MSTIVIVDDQAINRNIYAKMATAVCDDVRVETFADPRKALCAMQKRIPDLIVTDYRMPGMNGASFIRRIRTDPELADIPTIVITVYDEKSYRLRALDAGATDFLLSPVDHREFVTRARNLLKLRKQQALLAVRAQKLEHKLERSERSLEQAIRHSSERLAQVIDCVPAPISATDRNGRVLFTNECYARLFSIDPTTLLDRDPRDIFGEENAARHKALDQLVLRSGRATHSFEEEIADQSGQRRVFLTTKSPLNDGSNNTYGVVTSAIDITDQKTAQHYLQFLAHHDSLTGIANRTYLFEQIDRAIARSRRGDRRFALHVIDLDGFKQVNDVKGHTIGDETLVSVAKRLQSIKQEECVIARLGGDEFAVLQVNMTDKQAAVQLAEEISRILREPFEIDGGPAVTTASIGVAIHPVDGQDIAELLRHADFAMYKAKAEGGNQYRFYDAGMDARALPPAVLDADLRTAIEREEFVLHYQPQVRLDSGEVLGVEALLRWQKRDGTLVPPCEFLPRAEDNGLILPINEWVLRRACHQAAAWRRAGMRNVRIGVNLSAIQFRRKNLPLLVTRVLNESGLDPSSLELELTENFLMHDFDQVAIQLQQLRELGVIISIDDFGTGFSSLCYVKQLPVDRLKIDQIFIHDLIKDPSDRAIVAAIINLAHSLKMEVVAEGVETADQLEWLTAAGCDEAQGFYCGRPMIADDFAALVSKAARVAHAG
jgi:diguanylate cyclase (GGDEF)-like protein/PAS domain S-box-containing protein